jgi:hypothetical protein
MRRGRTAVRATSLATVVLLSIAYAPASCGGATDTQLIAGPRSDSGSGGDAVSSDDATAGDDVTLGDDGSTQQDASDGPTCLNLQCQQVDCAAQSKPTTTISGTVYNPAGNLPLYDVLVYVPNAPLAPITPGNVQCTPCQAPASGSPLVSATTDAKGKFVLKNAPSGPNIPLVMQLGKWRRRIVIPQVTECTDNPQTNKDQTRLPKKQSEGDMPQIAFTTGCDSSECFLRHVGIDDSEFTAPSGNGRVHVYTGQSGTPIVNGGNTSQQTYAWWSDHKNLLEHDIVFDACECTPYDRNSNGGGSPESAYAAMHLYLEAGGRLIATHFFYNWFSPPTGPADFQSVANWQPATAFQTFFVDTSFPRSKAFADWLQATATTTTYAQIVLFDMRYDVGATVSGKSSRWMYAANAANDPQYSTMYLTFNAPVGQPPAKQCGRAAFSDLHLVNFTAGMFPQECANQPDSQHAATVNATEFLFFDLSSCVQNDAAPPLQPPFK